MASLCFVLPACFGKPPIQDEPYPTRVTAGGNIVGESKVDLVARDNSFSPDTVRVDDTKYVRLTIVNEGENPHTFTIEEIDIDTGTIDPGARRTLLFPAPAEPQTFVCKIHVDLGMRGRLVVQ